MIYKLRRNLIWICGASVVAVFVIIFVLIYAFSRNQLNSIMDSITDRIAENEKVLFDSGGGEGAPPQTNLPPDFFKEENRFQIQFFIVRFDLEGEITSEQIDPIASIASETAHAYAREALEQNRERGWVEDCRYKVCDTETGQTVVFADGKMNRSVSNMTLMTAGAVLIGSLLVIIALIVIFSKRAVGPIAESYKKQKQFITDANHELKTPLTLILTNLDIVEAELGKNEWLDDIRAEGERMNALVQQLVTMTRMDEDENAMADEPFQLSDTVSDTVSEFKTLAEIKGMSLRFQIQPGIAYSGDEEAIRRLIAILLDNAVKYCDPGGEIALTLQAKRKITLTVENSCANVGELELDKLFDRFYRADKARTFDGGFGIGLSIAKAIARRHHGDISVCKKDGRRISFKVTLRR